MNDITLDDLYDNAPDHLLPWLDRAEAMPMNNIQRHWREHGYVILKKFVPDDVVDEYCRVREVANGWERLACPYMIISELRSLCCFGPLAAVLKDLFGEPMGVHLNLCTWTSTERDYHQDIYLNPPYVYNHYAAVWFALDSIHPDSGPFEFVSGSHRWGHLSREKVIGALLATGLATNNEVSYGSWPWNSEKLLTPLFENEIKARGASPEKFLGDKGDVLIWHSQLLHRGSRPNVPGMIRKSCIAHYSAISKRQDMPRADRHGDGYYFVLPCAATHAMRPKGQ